MIFLKVVFMAQGKRDRLSAEQRTDMWRRWKAGESLHEIGRAFGKDHGSIQFLLSQRGGIVPAARRRSLRTLTVAERLRPPDFSGTTRHIGKHKTRSRYRSVELISLSALT
jgi:hypothetical protein